MTTAQHAMGQREDSDDPGIEVAERLLRRRAGLPAGDPERVALRRDAIILCLPLARRLALRFSGRGEPLDDLVQVAALALVQAVDSYRPDPVRTFAGYLVPTVCGRLRNHFRDQVPLIRIPRPVRELRADLRLATDELTQRHCRTPTVAELAEYLHVPPEAIRAADRAGYGYRPVSLDGALLDGTGRQRYEVLGAEDHHLTAVVDRLALRTLLGTLPIRDQRILAMRFADRLGNTQIATVVGVSPVHVSRLVNRALALLRAGLLDG